MNILRYIAAVAVHGCLFHPAAAVASEFTGIASLTSEYIYRGLAQSDGNPAFQLGCRRDALAKQKENGHRFTLRSFEIDDNNPPGDGAELYAGVNDDTLVGSVNCSGWSWGMNKTIGNASIKSEHAALEHAWIEPGGQRLQVRLSHGPLITLKRRNKVPASL